jgi:exopolysaccharide production protein ExoQ
MHAVSRARPGFELGLDFCAFLFLPVLALASRGAAPLAVAAGLCALGLAAPRRMAAWRGLRGLRGLALIFAALVAGGLASALWAVDPAHSVSVALRLAGMFAAGLALMAASREVAAPERLLGCFAVGLVVALALATAQALTNGGLTLVFAGRPFAEPALNQVENGLGFTLLPLTATLVLLRRRVAAAVVAALTVAVICLLVGDAARLGFALGVIGAGLIYWRRRWMTRAAAIVSVVVILAAPLVFPPLAGVGAIHHGVRDFKFSAWHRLEIWSFVGERIAERPLLGWGLDASRAIPGGTALTPEGRQWLPLHPHNAPLQLWLELGVPGAALFALFVARLWLALGAVGWPRLYAAAAGGSLVTGLVVALGSYGIWQEWLIGTEFLTLFLILVMARLVTQPMPETRDGSIS